MASDSAIDPMATYSAFTYVNTTSQPNPTPQFPTSTDMS